MYCSRFALEKQGRFLYNAPMANPKSTLTSAAPRLVRRAEFEAVLQDYHLSPEGLKIFQETPFAAMVAPTSTGRNTVIKELLKTGKYYFIVSDTTRPPRQNDGVWEQDGLEYFFRKEDDLLDDLKAGMFVEAEIIHNQQVSGVSIREIKKAQEQGKIAITDVEILGGIAVNDLNPNALVIYLVPPSFDEWLRRIHGRTPVGKEELCNRMETALKSFRLALEHNHFVFIVSDKLENTVKAVDDVVRLGRHHAADEQAAKELVRTLHAQTEAYLKQL
jgi:guanylate kinase